MQQPAAGPTTVEALHDRLKKHEDAIGDKLGEFLQHQGLFDDNPVRVRRENLGDAVEWGMLAGALMGVGSGLWLALWLSQWWANALAGAFIGFMYMMFARRCRRVWCRRRRGVHTKKVSGLAGKNPLPDPTRLPPGTNPIPCWPMP